MFHVKHFAPIQNLVAFAPQNWVTDPFVRFLRSFKTAPHPLATAVPAIFLPRKGRLTAPPLARFVTLAAFVFDTTVLPFAPALFFFRAVDAL